MYIDKIREAFEKIGFSGETRINQSKFNEILGKLMVTLATCSLNVQAKATIRMWQMSCGTRPHRAGLTSRSTRSAKQSTMVSTYSRTNSRKSTVSLPPFR